MNLIPIYELFTLIGNEIIDPMKKKQYKMNLRPNSALTYQTALGKLGEAYNYTFYDIASVYNEYYIDRSDKYSLLKF